MNNENKIITINDFGEMKIKELLTHFESAGLCNRIDGLNAHEMLTTCMSEVRKYWLGGCDSCCYEDESLIQCEKSAIILLYALKTYSDMKKNESN